METIDIARRLAQLGRKEDAIRAYTLVLRQFSGKDPLLELEAANYIFFEKGDYRVAYTTFVSLYNRGFYQPELMELMTQAFYLPNVAQQKKLYEENCTLFDRYPFIFRDRFEKFEKLPVQFFPFDDNGYIPFYKDENRFGEYIDFNNPVIDRYFFQDLEKPVLTKDLYSQYQLEYLNDTVRESMWVGRENHIYLHYSSWKEFCIYMQCLKWKRLLQDKKFVFLFGKEISKYPIDFKDEFGIDYSQYPVKPLGIGEINRLIWHAQLSFHNGGDFFNEVFHGHPNLLIYDSVMFDSIEGLIANAKKELRHTNKIKTYVHAQLAQIKHPTDKDFLVATFLTSEGSSEHLDRASRIVPALFFQPHYGNMKHSMKVDKKTKNTLLFSEQYDKFKNAPLFKDFKYIKTFVPMRRITTSFAATVRFLRNEKMQELFLKNNVPDENTINLPGDTLAELLLNRNYIIDATDRLLRDSVLVRFEDGKLNPKATFTALAEFLDIPYTESMTYCSNNNGINPEALEGNVRGFDPASVYRTYDEFTSDDERALLEYFFRDAYECYGYDFKYYHGETVTREWVESKIEIITLTNQYLAQKWREALIQLGEKTGNMPSEESLNESVKNALEGIKKKRMELADILLQGLRFVNKDLQPLRMMTPLKLDPELLEQPLYH
jgi:hypothetical protein